MAYKVPGTKLAPKRFSNRTMEVIEREYYKFLDKKFPLIPAREMKRIELANISDPF